MRHATGYDTVDITSNELVVRTYRTFLETTKETTPTLMSETAVSSQGETLRRWKTMPRLPFHPTATNSKNRERPHPTPSPSS